MKGKKDVDVSGPKAQEKARSNYEGQELESRRVGTQQRLKEVVKDVVEDKTAQAAARQARYTSTGEQSEGPDLDDFETSQSPDQPHARKYPGRPTPKA